jgi:hypothetical protein
MAFPLEEFFPLFCPITPGIHCSLESSQLSPSGYKKGLERRNRPQQ